MRKTRFTELVEADLEGAIRALKAERDGEIEVAGPDLARSLTELGLIDEYRIYLHPVVLGHGQGNRVYIPPSIVSRRFAPFQRDPVPKL